MKEVAFKVSKKTKELKANDSSINESDVEESRFMRKLKRIFGKYRGNLPIKSFSCGKLEYFVAKCPYAKCEEEEHQNRSKSYKHKRGMYSKKNGFYSREDIICSKESDKYASNINKEELPF